MLDLPGNNLGNVVVTLDTNIGGKKVQINTTLQTIRFPIVATTNLKNDRPTKNAESMRPDYY
eukprot:scaffold1051_cov119-Cylindrotheca_fusiformis.AAC.25